MWFVFPQIRGLGHSSISRKFGISSLEEAVAYLLHPVLGARLKECVETVLQLEGRTASQIFGSPDDMKFRSSLTLFAEAAPEMSLFQDALKKYYDGETDPRTIAAIGEQTPQRR